MTSSLVYGAVIRIILQMLFIRLKKNQRSQKVKKKKPRLSKKSLWKNSLKNSNRNRQPTWMHVPGSLKSSVPFSWTALLKWDWSTLIVLLLPVTALPFTLQHRSVKNVPATVWQTASEIVNVTAFTDSLTATSDGIHTGTVITSATTYICWLLPILIMISPFFRCLDRLQGMIHTVSFTTGFQWKSSFRT